MNTLYLWLNVGSIAIPFAFSFYPKLKLYKQWNSIFLAIICTMLFYIPWDIIFTKNGIWGFNTDYLLGTSIAQLPIEEWLFFICIPYACIFTHYALLHFFPRASMSITTTKRLSYISIGILGVLTIMYYDRWYTLINFGYAIILLLFSVKRNIKLLSSFYCTFLVILIPFFIVNGVLTGSGIPDEVVWYNNDENMGIRMFTIPIEDSVYAFTLLFTNVSLTQWFKKNLFRQ